MDKLHGQPDNRGTDGSRQSDGRGYSRGFHRGLIAGGIGATISGFIGNGLFSDNNDSLQEQNDDLQRKVEILEGRLDQTPVSPSGDPYPTPTGRDGELSTREVPTATDFHTTNDTATGPGLLPDTNMPEPDFVIGAQYMETATGRTDGENGMKAALEELEQLR